MGWVPYTSLGDYAMTGVQSAAAGAGFAAGKYIRSAYRNWRTPGRMRRNRRGVQISPIHPGLRRRLVKRRRLVRSRAVRRKSKVIPKRIKRYVKYATKNVKQLICDYTTNVMHSVGSAVNVVSYKSLLLNSISTWLLFLSNEQILTAVDGVSTIVTQVPADLTSVYKKYVINMKTRLKLKNNTNAPAEICIYFLKCNDATSVTPLLDLDARITATQIARNGGAAATKENQLHQYWTTPASMKDCKWDIFKRYKFDMLAGEEYDKFFDYSFQVDTKNSTAQNYIKGFPSIVSRIMGKPSHDTTTVTTGGLNDTLVDIWESSTYSVHTYGDSTNIAVHQTQANSGFSLVTPVVATDDTVQDRNFG